MADPLAPPADAASPELEPALVRDSLQAQPAEPPRGTAQHLPSGTEVYGQRRPLLRLVAVIVIEEPAARIVPFLAEHFVRSYVIRSAGEIPAGLPEHVRPTVVIQILSEGGALLR